MLPQSDTLGEEKHTLETKARFKFWLKLLLENISFIPLVPFCGERTFTMAADIAKAIPSPFTFTLYYESELRLEGERMQKI